MVRLGDLDLNSNIKDNATPLDIGIDKFITHERYDRKARIEDIGLIRLKEDVTYTSGLINICFKNTNTIQLYTNSFVYVKFLLELIQPICLPTEPDDKTKTFVKYHPFVAGWGATDFSK